MLYSLKMSTGPGQELDDALPVLFCLADSGAGDLRVATLENALGFLVAEASHAVVFVDGFAPSRQL